MMNGGSTTRLAAGIVVTRTVGIDTNGSIKLYFDGSSLPKAGPSAGLANLCLTCRFESVNQARSRHIHDKALESEWKKAEITGGGHLKNLPALKHGENVVPFGSRPVIPEFP